MIILQSVRKILQYCQKNLTVENSKMQEKQVLQRMTISFSVYVFIGMKFKITKKCNYTAYTLCLRLRRLVVKEDFLM